MCGIVGVWRPRGMRVDPREVMRATRLLQHRGPDDEGYLLANRSTGVVVPCGGDDTAPATRLPHLNEVAGGDFDLALGFRRLAILDRVTGHQPMSFADGRYWIVYNGEVFNFLELRRELEDLGHCFVTESDTEVVLASYVEWGSRCLARFNGMWSFAIWDRRDDSIFLARDRFGVKPLYYTWTGRTLAFASELKAFLALRWIDLRFDPSAVTASLADVTSIEATETTILAGVRRLPAGYCLRVHESGCDPQRWWSTIDHVITPPTGFDAQGERLRELLLDSCRIRMRSDVRVGCALSGGLDSSAISGCLNALSASDVARTGPSYRAAFHAWPKGTDQDERAFAEDVARFTHMDLLCVETCAASRIDNIDTVVFQQESVGMIGGLAAARAVYQAQRKHGIMVSLDGYGADELFAGYPFHVELALAMSEHPAGQRELQATLDALDTSLFYRMTPRKHPSSVPSAREGGATTFTPIHGWGRPSDRLLSVLKIPPPAARFPDFDADRAKLGALSPLDTQLYYDFHCTTLPHQLREFDRLSMAHGVEVRMPFLDWRLVTFAFSLPFETKIGQGQTKRVLRAAVKDLIPDSARLRMRKRGFVDPIAEWAKLEPMRSYVADGVNSQEFLESEIWDGPRIRDIVGAALRDGAAPPAWNFVTAMRLFQLFRQWRTDHA